MIKIALLALVAAPLALAAQDQIIHVPLAYRQPADSQPKPNFSPKGMQFALTPVAASLKLPVGAMRPARIGEMKIGPDKKSWMKVLLTVSADHPHDLCQMWIDRNRNGSFIDDGAPLTTTPTQPNKNTRSWWSSINKVALTVPYASTKSTESYFVNFWSVREDSSDVLPDIARFSAVSWRYGTAEVNGVKALVAAMDMDNNALFDKEDEWSVISADQPKAESAVLTTTETRPTSRFMFLPTANGKELVLEFRKFSPDGKSVDFAVVDRDMTKKADRAPDDLLAVERPRPRATVPFAWEKTLDAALAKAKEKNLKVFVDFATTWCGPCHQMDDWIWTDKEVAAKMNEMYVGVKLDGDIEKALVARYTIAGYPHMLVLDADGKVLQRVVGYQSSKEILGFFDKKP